MKATRFLLALFATTAFATAGDDTAQVLEKLKELKAQVEQLKQLQLQLEGLDGASDLGSPQLDPVVPAPVPSPAPAPSPAAKVFQYRMGTLRGATLQPAGAVQPSGGVHVQAAAGVQPSGPDRGPGPVVTRPMTEEQWRQLFPVKNGAAK